MRDLLVMFYITLIGIFVIYLTNRCTDNTECNHNPIEIIKKDTVILHDTIYYNNPVPTYITKLKTDTIFISDTVYTVLPIEQKTYSDDSTYTLQISGFKANLDYIEVYPRTTYITQEKVSYIKRKQPFFEFKPSIGMGYGIFNRNVDLFVGASLILNLE